MTPTKFALLVEKAKQYNNQSFAYAESQLYASRDNETSITDITMAIKTARGQVKPLSDKEAMYLLANSAEYQQAERDLFEAAKKVINAQISHQTRYGLPVSQSNEVLYLMCQHLKEQLFTGTLLNTKY